MALENLSEKSTEIERDGPGELNIGDLVRITDETQTVNGNTVKYRAIGYMPNDEGGIVWVGPAHLTPRDIDEFIHEFEEGHPRSSKFQSCKPVQMSRLEKVLDS